MEKLSVDRRWLTWNAHFSLVVIGIAITALGPAMPFLIEEYNISLAQAGLVMTFLSLGRLMTVSLAGGWSDRVGRKPVMVLGAAGIGIGAMGFAISPVWIGQLLSVFVVGGGLGMLDGGANSLITDLYTQKRGFALNRLHVFFGVGALAGPLLAALMINLFGSWRAAFYLVAAAAAVSTLTSALPAYPDAQIGKGISRETIRNAKKRFLAAREFWLLSGVMFMYTGIGNTVVGWVNKYLGDELTASVLAASTVLAMYHVGITVGRMACSYVSERIGYARTLLVCAVGGFGFITLAVLTQQLWWITLSFWMTGIFLAGLFPTAVAYGTGLFPDLRGTLSGYLITSAALGGMVMPLIIGAFSDLVGLRLGMLGVSFFGLLLVFIALGLQTPSTGKTASSV